MISAHHPPISYWRIPVVSGWLDHRLLADMGPNLAGGQRGESLRQLLTRVLAGTVASLAGFSEDEAATIGMLCTRQEYAPSHDYSRRFYATIVV